MKFNNKLKSGMFFLILIFLVFSVSAVYSRSNPNYGAFDSFVGESYSFDSQYCEAGQDFILQIAPFGCEPAVVRSDLLEEQNVPVFCQIAATKINPLIDVEAIESISFSGEYPNEVSGVGFHPARAALGVQGDLNSPILNNIGYAVIVLKKEAVEANMPEYVQGNLTARISYDIKNAFGIGKASFYIPQLSDEDWNEQKNQYSFWSGRGYLKAEGIDENGATILVYNDIDRISSVNLNKGETSDKIYIPGFDCLAQLQVKLDGLEAPDTRAKLEINGEIVEAVQGEYFLDNNCRVTRINKQGIVQNVEITCNTDDSRSQKLNLKISPRVKLDFTGANPEGYQVGDYLYEADNGKFVYLGYVGTNGDSGKESDLYSYLIAIPQKRGNLTNSEISEVATIAYEYENKRITGVGLVDFIANKLKYVLAASSNLYKHIADGKNFKRLSYQRTAGESIIGNASNSPGMPYDRNTNFVLGKLVYLDGFADAQDKKLTGATKENYDNAMKDYDMVLNSYSNEIFDAANKVSYGEEALYKKIIFAFNSEQKITASELCEEFKSGYPNSKKNLKKYCDEKWRLSNPGISSQDIVINNIVKRISFEGIYEPTPDEYSAVIKVTGPNKKVQIFTMRHNQVVNLVGFRDKDENEFIQLVGLEEGKASIKYNLDAGTLNAVFSSDTKTIGLNVPEVFGSSNYLFELTKVNLKKVAKVSVIPSVDNAGTTASFPFKIGIEKRSIQLSPEKTKERIENLEKTIADWQDKSDKLGKVVKGLKGACLATGAYLTIKNFMTNLGGEGIARQEVMRGAGGWNEKCAGLVNQKKYSSIDECIFDNSNNIDEDVDEYYNALTKQNNEIKTFEDGCEKTEFLTETHINTDCFKNKFAPGVTSELSQSIGDRLIDVGGGEKVKASEVLKGVNANSTSIEQLRSLQLNSRVDSDMARAQLDKDLKDIYANTRTVAEINSLVSDASSAGFEDLEISWNADKDAIKESYSGGKVSGSEISGINDINVSKDYNVKLQGYGSKQYLFILDKGSGSTYGGTAYEFKGFLDGKINVGEKNDEVSKKFTYNLIDKNSYTNPFKSVSGETGVVVKFYETEPYKGLPALVPFDLKNGWYAATKQTLSIFGGIKSYDESGKVTSVWVCNVGENKIAEFKSGIGDDICEQVNLGTGAAYNNFPGLSESESRKIVSCAIDAINSASNYKSGSDVSIRTSCGGSISVKVGKPAIDIPEMQCSDYMSPDECQLLFNVCDPVICPSSRCDLGGAYPVKDVIQSGIIGSIALCLPNIKEGIYIPVCLTGIKAGIDGYLSVVKAHRDCLQESLDTGETVGICDEIYSINLCEFFWRQSLPVAKLVIPKLLEVALGQNVRGGGEYLGVANAWTNAEQSINYFTQYYAANSFEAFKARTAEAVGGEICQNFVSGVYPEGGNLLDSLTEPDSPPQYHGRFDEIPFTTATVPAISQYKVFYHIYAGEDRGAYYQVYLTEGAESSFYQDTSYRRIVDSGYIARGGYADETKDFTAPSGYKQMCIRVNNQEECGFKQVSTSYAVNYIEDKYLEEQTSQKNIKSEAECISGTSSAYSLISPNIQEGVNEVIDPSIYNRGIIRICATNNPGIGSDAKAGGEGSRWLEVGYCDDSKIKCWIDRKSINRTIGDLDIKNKVLSELENNSLKRLEEQGNYVSRDTVEEEIKKKEQFLADGKYQDVIDLVKVILAKTFWNDQKVKLILNRADAYAGLVELSNAKVGTISPELIGEDLSGSSIRPELVGEGVYDTADGLCNSYCLDQKASYHWLNRLSNSCPVYDGFNLKTSKENIINDYACCCYSDENINSETQKEEPLTCSSYPCGTASATGQDVMGQNCWQSVGKELMTLSESIGAGKGISDTEVFENTGVKNFKCLVLMMARQEGCLAHCKYKEGESNPLYCRQGEDKSLVVEGDGGDAIGIMQISISNHGNNYYSFEENVKKGASYLIERYNYCKNNQGIQNWLAAVSSYNGMGCVKYTSYSEKVLKWGTDSQFIDLFPECRVDEEALCRNYCEEQKSPSEEIFYSYSGLTDSQCDSKEADQDPYSYSTSLYCCCYYKKGLVASDSIVN